MNNYQEGGYPDTMTHVSARPPRMGIDPEQLYYSGKHGFDTYLSMLGIWGYGIRNRAVELLQNTRDASSRNVAKWFRALSDFIWDNNKAGWFFNLQSGETEIPIQKEFNNRLVTHNDDGTLNHIRSDHLLPLFEKGDEASWPNLILTSNHARAWRHEDLSQLMQGIERMANDGWPHSKLNSFRLEHKETQAQAKQQIKDAAGRNIVVLACHTERDIFCNGAKLIDRRLDLEEDPNKENPAARTLSNISPAAMRLAKLMMKLMVEPEYRNLVDLDRSVPKFAAAPFIADEVARPITLRADAARIAQHIKLVGYSRGANTVTDALRFFYQECATLKDNLRINDAKGPRAVTASDIRTIISNMGLLSLAPGEVPLTAAERNILGIRRVSILNENDLTAGHLVKPDTSRYDLWSDRLITINGTTHDAGHNLVKAIGDKNAAGFIMDPANADDPHFRAAQDEVKAFFASNMGKNAITSFCFFGNELYLQYAPGIGRADENKLKNELLETLHENGFTHARAYSDLTHRRRVQIILDDNATPIEYRPQAIERCHKALTDLKAREGGDLFITQDAMRYLDETAEKAQPGFRINGAIPHAAGKSNGHHL